MLRLSLLIKQKRNATNLFQLRKKLMATSLTVRAPTSVYVGDLHHDVSEGQLIEAFKEFPSLSSVRVCRDAVTGRSLRYGYVNFLSPQDGTLSLQ